MKLHIIYIVLIFFFLLGCNRDLTNNKINDTNSICKKHCYSCHFSNYNYENSPSFNLIKHKIPENNFLTIYGRI